MTSLMADLRFALRMMRKAPGFTAVAILSLALGMGPNTAIFSLVNTLLFQEWGVHEPEGLVDIYTLTRDDRHFYSYYSVFELADEGMDDVFDDVTTYAMYAVNLERDGTGELVLGEIVKGNYFDVMGVSAAQGRTFLPEEDATPGTHPVVVLSHRYWQSRHGGDPALVGREVRVNGRPYTVVGITPATFRGRISPGIGSDFWVPLQMYPHLSPDKFSNGDFSITGRLRPGITPQRANQELAAVAARYNESRPESRSQLRLDGVNVADVRFHPDLDGVVGAMAALLVVAVGLVLLVACVNLAGFFLARATDRRKEVAVRVALGAGRGAILRQLLVESLLLSALGGALGLLLGQAALRLVLSYEPPLPIPVHLEVALDGRLLAFTGISVAVAAVLFGLAPALEATRSPVASTLRDEAGSSGGRRKVGARQLMVGAQMALSTVLLFAGGLFVRSLQSATERDVGFSTAPAAVVGVEPWANQYTAEQDVAFVNALVDNLRSTPGIRQVAVADRLPLALGAISTAVAVPGVEPPPDANAFSLEFTPVTPGYFATMGIELAEGRDFDGGDAPEGQQVAVVSRAAAQLFWPGQSAVGKTMFLGGDLEREVVVVGVADDVPIWSLTEAPRPYFYVPVGQRDAGQRHLVVARGDLPAGELAARIRDEARRLDPEIFISDVGTMADHLGYIFFLPRMAAAILSAVGLLALLLASIGLYGMVSYSVARRTREMGIRQALGAEAGQVVSMVMRGGMKVVLLGGAVGMAAALALGAVVERFLIGVGSFDPLALVAAPLVLTSVAAAATWLPARRVSRVDPVQALRSE
ncbi:MAG: ABC transporter permease [Longimicrobiales bacterium]|nr:ABC transporter permease [Longimicrobiales bacterium]